jgi:hypothetical protein
LLWLSVQIAEKTLAFGKVIIYVNVPNAEILVKALGENDIVVSCEKQKDGPEFDTMQFLKVSVEPSLALQQVSRSVPKAKLTSNQAMAMDAFYEATKAMSPLLD